MQSRITPAFVCIALLAVVCCGTASAQWVPGGAPYGAAANDQLSPATCPDGKGGAILVWMDSRNAPYQFDLYAQRVDGQGNPRWTLDGVPVCTVTGDQILPVIAADGQGGAIIAWEDLRNVNSDVFAQRVDSLGAIQWTAAGVLICNQLDTQTSVQVVADGQGGAIVCWEDYRNLFPDIFAQRVNPAGVAQWTANGVSVCGADDDQFEPRIVADGGGGAFVTWFDDRNFDFDIFAQRINAGGISQWTANGVAVCIVDGTQDNPVLTQDGAGGVIIAWEDLRDTVISFDIYAQRLNASGAAQWASGGVRLCGDDSDQLNPTIAPNTAGGAIVAWEDSRGTRPDIYAQRVNAAGVAQWAVNGLPACTATGTQQLPLALSDGAGGAVIVWEDLRFSVFNTDLYAQRLGPAGNPLWDPNGMALTNAGTDQVGAAITSDGAGGVVAAWEDGRSGLSSDVYAQRITIDGVPAPTLDVPTGGAARFALAASPNPCRTRTALQFVLPSAQSVTAEVFDLSGRRVKSIARDAWLPAGAQTLGWDGRDEAGQRLAGGVYLVRVATASGAGMRKVTLLP